MRHLSAKTPQYRNFLTSSLQTSYYSQKTYRNQVEQLEYVSLCFSDTVRCHHMKHHHHVTGTLVSNEDFQT